MADFIVAKNTKLNNLISIYFFVLIVLFGALGFIVNLVIDNRTAYSEAKEKLEVESRNILDLLKESLEHKENIGLTTNILVSQIINNPLYYQKSNLVKGAQNEYRGLDSRSGVYLPGSIELSTSIKEEIDSTNYIWSIIPPLLLREFNNYWYISKKGFLRIVPSKWAFEIRENEGFGSSIYYKLGTPEENPDRSPMWTPIYYDTTIKRWMTSFIVPLYKEDEFLGVTGSDLYLDMVIKKLFSGINFVIYDNSKRVIYDSSIDQQERTSLEYVDFTIINYELITEPYRINNSDWSVSFYLSRDYFKVYGDGSQSYLIILFLLGAFIISVISWLLVRNFVISPINKLSIAASDFNFSDNIKRITKRKDEIGTLAKSLITMGETIKNQIREIKLESQDRVESEKKFRRLIGNLGKEYFFYSYSTNNQYTYISNSIEQMLGFTPEIFITQFQDLFPDTETNRDFLTKRGSSIKGIKQPSYYLEIKTVNEELKLIELVETPIFNSKGHVISIEGIAHDITEIKRGEEELKNHKENLEEIIANRTAELENTLLELVETKKMASLGELVSGVAHEINTPVGIGVTASTHLTDITRDFQSLYTSNNLSKSKFEKFIDEMLETSKIVLTNMIKAASLIKGFKEIAVDQTCNDIRAFNIKEYIDEILLSIHSEIKHTKHRIDLDIDENIRVKTYPGALSQIVTNLIFNTIYHGFEGIDEGVISIDIDDGSKDITLVYKDNGKGIEKEVLDKIYNPFFTTKRGRGGSGLGMNIVWNLVIKTLKGSIKCDSKPGEGVKFTIVFPKEVED